MRTRFPAKELLLLAARELGPIHDRVVYVGGAVVGLLVVDSGGREPRATIDVDVVVEIAHRIDYYQLEQALHAQGFQNDIFGPICRYTKGPLILDVMPSDPEILGFSNRWYSDVLRLAEGVVLDGVALRVIPAPYLIGTKLEAFRSDHRENAHDLLASRDLEDIVVLLDGRPGVDEECLQAEAPLRDYLAEEMERLLLDDRLEYAIAAHLEPDHASQARRRTILERWKRIAGGG